MRKTTFLILLTTFYILLSGVTPAFAAPTPAPPDLHLRPNCNPTLAPDPAAAAAQVQKLKAAGQWKSGDLENPCNLTTFVYWIQYIIRFMFYISIPISVMFVIYGSFVIMTAGGSEERFGKGKKIIWAAIIGIIIVFTANLTITTIERALKSGAEQLLK